MKNDITTVKDIIIPNDTDEDRNIPVLLEKAFKRDLCYPMRETLWKGKIKDVPEEYHSLEVLSVGWLFGKKITAITVLEEAEHDNSI